MSGSQQQGYVVLAAVDDSTGASVPGYFTDKVTVYITGTFDSATVTLEASPDDGTTWAPVAGVSATAATVVTVDLVATAIRGVVAGSTTAASISMQVVRN